LSEQKLAFIAARMRKRLNLGLAIATARALIFH